MTNSWSMGVWFPKNQTFSFRVSTGTMIGRGNRKAWVDEVLVNVIGLSSELPASGLKVLLPQDGKIRFKKFHLGVCGNRLLTLPIQVNLVSACSRLFLIFSLPFPVAKAAQILRVIDSVQLENNSGDGIVQNAVRRREPVQWLTFSEGFKPMAANKLGIGRWHWRCLRFHYLNSKLVPFISLS